MPIRVTELRASATGAFAETRASGTGPSRARQRAVPAS
jgi:hypothetical protein